jgi:integrase
VPDALLVPQRGVLGQVPVQAQPSWRPTPEEIRLVLRAADKDRDRHLWYLALSGLRRGEVAGLKWSDADLGAGTITIARNRVQAGAGRVQCVHIPRAIAELGAAQSVDTLRCLISHVLPSGTKVSR